MRSENQKMHNFLAENGFADVRVKYLDKGSLSGRWRLFKPDCRWTEDIANKLTSLGFKDFDNNALSAHSGNGGSFSVFVIAPDGLNTACLQA